MILELPSRVTTETRGNGAPARFIFRQEKEIRNQKSEIRNQNEGTSAVRLSAFFF